MPMDKKEPSKDPSKEPSKREMKAKDLEAFKKRLIEQREKLIRGIAHCEEDSLKKSQRDASGDLSGYTFHMADVATDNYDREFSLDLASSEQQILNAIDDALRKIQDGTFGTCESCSRPIKLERLRAVPYTRFCISCQEAEEKRTRRS